MAEAMELPVGYYQRNFQTLLEFVLEHDADVLSPDEIAYAKTFLQLSEDAARLYVRLISRKGPHFRRDKLVYEEIQDLDLAAKELEQHQLLIRNGDFPAEDLLQLLLKAELDELASAMDQVPKRKDALLVYLSEHLSPETIRQSVLEHFQVWTPLGYEYLLVFRLLFFGNLNQDLTEFVLLDLGLLRYEAYEINKADRLFLSRSLVTHTLAWIQVREQAWLAEQAGEGALLLQLCDQLPDTLDEGSLKRRHDKVLNTTARYLERQKDYETALTFYERAIAPPSRERRTRIMERLERFQDAWDLCEQIEAQPLDESEKTFLEVVQPRLQKKLGLPVIKKKRMKHPVTELIMPKVPDQKIETTVLDYLAEKGTSCFYSENHLWSNLFGLTFWDIIFMPIRGAFFNRYQRGPKGMFSPRFRQEREAVIANRLQQVANDPDWPEQLLSTAEDKHGITNYMVNWRGLDLELIQQVVEVVPRPHMVAIFDRLSRHLGEYRSGLPDLFLFDGEHGYTLMEVKGPGDQIQGNQGKWMKYFHEQGIPYTVAKVRWDD